MSTPRGDVRSLSVSEKIEPCHLLGDDFEAHAPALTEEESAELDERIANLERNPSTIVSWQQAKADVLKQ